MNQKIGIACAALIVLAGCATRPATGPGSGAGPTYEPMVQSHTRSAEAYNFDVSECQKDARSYTFVTPTDHREALFILNTVTLGAAAVMTSGYVPALGATGTTWGLMNGFEYGVYSPQRAAFAARQETAIANCMARKGYLNVDPSVAVTWTPTPTAALKGLRRTGIDTFNAEKVAKLNRCSATPFANLVAKGPGFENYTVPCDGGRILAVRCTFGNCRPA